MHIFFNSVSIIIVFSYFSTLDSVMPTRRYGIFNQKSNTNMKVMLREWHVIGLIFLTRIMVPIRKPASSFPIFCHTA